MTSPVLVWLRKDLRVGDNPVLEGIQPILPVYIHDPLAASEWAHKGAGLWWLKQSLKALSKNMPSLLILHGPAHEILLSLAIKYGIKEVFYTPCVEPWRRAEETRLHSALIQHGIIPRPTGSPYLFTPGSLVKADGTPYRVFTPFYKTCLERLFAMDAYNFCASVSLQKTPPRFVSTQESSALSPDALCPYAPWHTKLEQIWQPGETEARKKLIAFIENEKLDHYGRNRDYLGLSATSRLSPHLAFGEITPLRILATVWGQKGSEAFVRQILWREFAAHTLWHFPNMPTVPFQPLFTRFPWKNDKQILKAWQKGETGIPLVDAGMRELWETGTLHNRARMVVASFLTKNLLQDWREGQKWFWDTLVDADLANNSFGWQWVAGCGMDAAPYFRIFNPFLQAQKFDPDAHYVSRWLRKVSIVPPLVDITESRTRALAVYQKLSM